MSFFLDSSIALGSRARMMIFASSSFSWRSKKLSSFWTSKTRMIWGSSFISCHLFLLLPDFHENRRVTNDHENPGNKLEENATKEHVIKPPNRHDRRDESTEGWIYNLSHEFIVLDYHKNWFSFHVIIEWPLCFTSKGAINAGAISQLRITKIVTWNLY